MICISLGLITGYYIMLTLGFEYDSYVKVKRVRSPSTAKTYASRLKFLKTFLAQSKYNNITDLLAFLNKEPKKVYDVFNEYISYLMQNHSLNPRTLSYHVNTAKDFLIFHEIDIIDRIFKNKVVMPNFIEGNKRGKLDKNNPTKIVNACMGYGTWPRLGVYILFLAVTDCRANEALHIRIREINLDAKPFGQILLHGKYTKTKCDRILYLTQELADHLTKWIEFKYRKRRNCRREDEKYVSEYRTFEIDKNDLLFAARPGECKSNGNYLYHLLAHQFATVLDSIGMGEKVECERNPNLKIQPT